MGKDKYDIIISGSDGFIGRSLSPKLEKFFNSKIILYLVHKENDRDRITNFSKTINGKVLPIDLLDKSALEKLPKSPKVLIHLAASTETSEKNHKANFPGTKNLIEAVSPLGKNSHVIYTGTTAIFAGRKDLQRPIDENTRPLPSNGYGETKLAAEKYLIDESKRQGFRLTILRVSTVYGQNPRKNGIFDMVKKSATSRIGFWARFNWPGLTSLIYVGDLCAVILHLVKKPPKLENPEIYLVYTESLRLSQIAQIVYKQLGREYKQFRLPRIFWAAISKIIRKVLPILEKTLSPKHYNLFWRISLVVNDTLHCGSTMFSKKFTKEFKISKFEDKVVEVIS